MEILDGKKLSEELGNKLAEEAGNLGHKLTLVIIQIGELEESSRYIKTKKTFGEKIGAEVLHEKFPEEVTGGEIIKKINQYNSSPDVKGIIVQLPMPAHLDKAEILEAIDPLKDVDCLTSRNIKLLSYNTPRFIPATTKGVLSLLKHYDIELKGKKAVVVGDSNLVGRPTALALLNEGATVTVCHKFTENLSEETKRADILISATGIPGLIKNEHVNKHQVVVDVGFSVVEGKVVGDVSPEVRETVEAITPVPGGVGPMTVLSLFENLLLACKVNS